MTAPSPSASAGPWAFFRRGNGSISADDSSPSSSLSTRARILASRPSPLRAPPFLGRELVKLRERQGLIVPPGPASMHLLHERVAVDLVGGQLPVIVAIETLEDPLQTRARLGVEGRGGDEER